MLALQEKCATHATLITTTIQTASTVWIPTRVLATVRVKQTPHVYVMSVLPAPLAINVTSTITIIRRACIVWRPTRVRVMVTVMSMDRACAISDTLVRWLVTSVTSTITTIRIASTAWPWIPVQAMDCAKATGRARVSRATRAPTVINAIPITMPTPFATIVSLPTLARATERVTLSEHVYAMLDSQARRATPATRVIMDTQIVNTAVAPPIAPITVIVKLLMDTAFVI